MSANDVFQEGSAWVITAETDAVVTDAAGLNKSIKAGEQAVYYATGTAVTVESGRVNFSKLPAGGVGAPGTGAGWGGDGNIDNALNIGHAARAAVCTLTAGDMAQGGSLTDGTTVLELDAPPGVKAHGTAEYAEGGYMRLRGSVTDADGRELVQVDVWASDNVDSLAGYLNAVSGMDAVMEFSNDGGALKAAAVAAGAAGNGLKLFIEEMGTPRASIEITLSGGADGVYSVQEIVSAINAETDFDVTAAAGEEENTITLTANTAGAAANAVTYTATGCFGSGDTRQGSTVRGLDVTSWGINLNGAPLDVEPAPLPTALTPTTAMRNSGVYTVEAAIDATAVTIPANATAEVWVRFGATTFNVTLPPAWVWVNGAASDMTGKTHTTFCITVRNDGAKVLASMQYRYDTTPAQS